MGDSGFGWLFSLVALRSLSNVLRMWLLDFSKSSIMSLILFPDLGGVLLLKYSFRSSSSINGLPGVLANIYGGEIGSYVSFWCLSFET